MIISQSTLFYIFLINGFIIGILFDSFRVLRRSFKTGIIITSIEDILFWLMTGGIILYSIFFYNNGIIRGYMFLGIFLGFIFYLLILSKFYIKINTIIISFLKKSVLKLIKIFYYPLKIINNFFKRTVFRGVSFIFINIRDFNKNFYKNNKLKEGFLKKM